MSDAPKLSASTTPDVSVVSPVYGCAGCLEDLVERLLRALSDVASVEIVLIDDGSPDGAWARIVEIAARHPQVRGFRLSRNFGQHEAIFAGLQQARGGRVVVMDCDGQDRPEEIPAMLRTADSTGVDMVLARRARRQDDFFKRLGSRAFYRLLSYLTDMHHDHQIANFGVYSRRLVDIVLAMPEAGRCFPLIVRWTGLSSASVPVEHDARVHGRSAYTVRRTLRLALTIVLSYSDKPLRLVVKLGMVLALLSFAVVLLSIYLYVSGRTGVAGYTSIIASVWLLGGLLIFSIGIMGLYIGQMFRDAKRRPGYLVTDYIAAGGLREHG